MPSLATSNGAVMLGKEMRLRLDPLHTRTLAFLAKQHGWNSPTEFAEALLSDAVEKAARNTSMSLFLQGVMGCWRG